MWRSVLRCAGLHRDAVSCGATSAACYRTVQLNVMWRTVVWCGVVWCGLAGLHSFQVGTGVGRAHLHGQTLEQSPIKFASWFAGFVAGLTGKLFEDSACFGCPSAAGLTHHGQKGNGLSFAQGSGVQVGPLGLRV